MFQAATEGASILQIDSCLCIAIMPATGLLREHDELHKALALECWPNACKSMPVLITHCRNASVAIKCASSLSKCV